MSSLDDLRERVVSPFGLVDRVWPVSVPTGLDAYRLYGATFATPITRGTGTQDRSMAAGSSFESADIAELTCIAEALERYSVGARGRDEHLVALERNLDGPVIDMAALPVCSARELATPGCPVTPYDSAKPLRWTQGVNLDDGSACWIPTGLVNYRLPLTDNEHFYFPISTGHAVHRTYDAALANALLEVVERDMVAVTWLQQLKLPTLPDEHIDGATRAAIDWLATNFVEVHLFDATSDLGVPIVYGLLVAPHDTRIRTWVSCAASTSYRSAAERAVRELLTSRVRPSTSPVDRPATIDDIETVLDGANYMADPTREHAFDFLRSDPRAAAEQQASLPEDPPHLLSALRSQLRRRGMSAFAVDHTSHELERVGFVAVSVIVPQLQPMSLWFKARFQGHPRLYELPRLLRYPVRDESELNPWPQPFP